MVNGELYIVTRERGLRESSNDFLEYAAAGVGEFSLAAAVQVFKSFTVQAHEVQQGGMDVADMDGFPD